MLDALFRRRFDRALDAEMRAHLAARAADLQRSGVSRADAERQARIEFGGLENYKEQVRETQRGHRLADFLEDARFGLRQLRRAPGFSLLALFCLTLGIGANTAVFSWIEGVLLRPYPLVQHQDRMVALNAMVRGAPGFKGLSWPDLVDFQRDCKLFDAFIADRITGTTLSVGDRAERTTGSVVSANYFDALGVRPVLGRGFAPEENNGRNAHPVVVISYQFWKDKFHQDPAIIGKTQKFNGVEHTIVGVAPAGFYGTFVGYAFQFWVPASMEELFDQGGYRLDDRGARWVEGFAFLKPGVTRAQAQQEIDAVAARLEREYPATDRGRFVQLAPLWQTPFNAAARLGAALQIGVVVVACVLLIACANVGNLLLVRAFARRHEVAMRLALGARRDRLVRQFLTEGLLLSLLAAAGGLLVAYWCRDLLARLIPPLGVPLWMPGNLDGRVLALNAAVCLLATLLFALAPSLHGSKVDLAHTLKLEGANVLGSREKAWLRSGLVLLQVSLSFVLLVGAGLVLTTLQRIRTASPGFAADGALVSGINLAAAGYDEARARNFQQQLLDRIQTMNGVSAAAYVRVAPFSYRGYSTSAIAVDGYEPPRDRQPTADYVEVSPRYLATMGIPLLAGREFTRADDANALPVVIVNDTLAAQYWPGADPVGKRIQMKGRWRQVVGVARTSKYRNIQESATPFLYVPLLQEPAPVVNLVIRTQAPLASIARTLAREVHALDPDLAFGEVITMRTEIERSLATQSIAVAFLGVFGGLAALLAGVGLYGVMSYVVAQSSRELGLRMALGAPPARLLRLVMTRGLVLTATGLALGLVVALAATRLMGYLLYAVSPRDPWVFSSALAVMTVAALCACLVPAWRAAHADPLQVLRN